MTRAPILLAALLLLTAAGGVRPDEMLPDPAQETRARGLGRELRCLVCQNQSIDESDADLARDLRTVVRERIRAGDDDAAVRRYLVARFGTYVLLDPPWSPATWALWLSPVVVLGLGGVALGFGLRRRQRPAPAPLSDDERRRLDALLAEREGGA